MANEDLAPEARYPGSWKITRCKSCSVGAISETLGVYRHDATSATLPYAPVPIPYRLGCRSPLVWADSSEYYAGGLCLA